MKKTINILSIIGIVAIMAAVYFIGNFQNDFIRKAEDCFDTTLSVNEIDKYYNTAIASPDISIIDRIREKEYRDKTTSNRIPESWKGIWGLGGEQGIWGRISIPSLGVSVPLNYSSVADFQAIVDAEDSALITDYWDGVYIADHNFQGFAALSDAVPDQTIMYIRNGDKCHKFICSMKDRNIHYDGEIWFSDGTNAMDFTYGDVIIQTCENISNINCVTWWRGVSE